MLPPGPVPPQELAAPVSVYFKSEGEAGQQAARLPEPGPCCQESEAWKQQFSVESENTF